MWKYLVKSYGYDGGHALVGIALALVLFSLGVPVFWAALLGGLIFAVPKEIYDMIHGRHAPTADTFSDLANYQTSWPAAYLAAGEPLLALYLFIAMVALYLPLLHLKGYHG